MNRALLSATCALALNGCASIDPQSRLNFSSEPDGAVVSDVHGTVLCQTPCMWAYLPDRDMTGDRAETRLRATWPSGTWYESTYTWYPRRTKNWNFHFKRPPGGDLQRDLAASQERAQERAQLEAAAAQKRREQAATIGEALLIFGGGFMAGRAGRTSSEPDLSPLFRKPQPEPSGYQTRDSFGNLVNSRDSFQTKDSFGNLVNSRDSYQTRDSFGNLVNSKSCFQTRDSFGNIVKSNGC